ncbi:MAG: hypothetical protein WHS86_13310 [Desulfosoma sp.]
MPSDDPHLPRPAIPALGHFPHPGRRFAGNPGAAEKRLLIPPKERQLGLFDRGMDDLIERADSQWAEKISYRTGEIQGPEDSADTDPPSP